LRFGEDEERNRAMAWIWNRFLPKAMRAETTPSARIHGYVAGKMQPDGPGLAMAVVKAGAVVHAAGYGLADTGGPPITAETIFHLASCGKQFTGLGIAMLAEEGKLDLDDPLAKHLPLLAAFGPQVTLRRLLHHTSGIRDLHDEDGIETNADIIRIYVDLGCPMAEDGGRPGDAFYYSNSGYDLLGAVIERVSGLSYHDFFQARVFDRLGMKDTFSVPDRRVDDPRCATGYIRDDRGACVEHVSTGIDEVVGSGSFYTTVTDLCRYDRALATNSLLSEAGMRQIFTSGRTNDGTPTNYGFGWSVGTSQNGRFAEHRGEWDGSYSYIGRFLDRPLSIFLLSNLPDLDLFEIALEATAAFD
jgi:CubicO group peptidase (beta-lactamase class C family)